MRRQCYALKPNVSYVTLNYDIASLELNLVICKMGFRGNDLGCNKVYEFIIK